MSIGQDFAAVQLRSNDYLSQSMTMRMKITVALRGSESHWMVIKAESERVQYSFRLGLLSR